MLVEIADTGTGIAPEIMARVFEPSFTTRMERGGTGLGLAVVHNLIVEHSGRIEVRSLPDIGTTFQIALPRFFPCCRLAGPRVRASEEAACA